MCNLLRCIYVVIKINSDFSYDVLFEKIDFSKCNMEKFNDLYNKKNIEKAIDENNERDKKYKEKGNKRAKIKKIKSDRESD